MTVTKEEVIEFFKSLGEAEAAELCLEAFKHKRIESHYGDGEFQIDDAYSLAICTFGSSHGEIDKEAIVQLYAKSSEKIQPTPEDGFDQMGQCDFCKTELISYEKRVICPVCMRKAGLT